MVTVSKYLIHQCSYPMDILITNLDKNRPGIGQEVARHGETIA